MRAMTAATDKMGTTITATGTVFGEWKTRAGTTVGTAVWIVSVMGIEVGVPDITVRERKTTSVEVVNDDVWNLSSLSLSWKNGWWGSKRSTWLTPEITDEGTEVIPVVAMMVVVGPVMVVVPVSPREGRAEVRGAETVGTPPYPKGASVAGTVSAVPTALLGILVPAIKGLATAGFSPLGIDVSTGPPIDAAVIVWGCLSVGVEIAGLGTSVNSALVVTGTSPPNETEGLLLDDGTLFEDNDVRAGSNGSSANTFVSCSGDVVSATTLAPKRLDEGMLSVGAGVWGLLWTSKGSGAMTSRAPVAAKNSVVAAGNDLEPEVINNEGSSVNVGSLKAEMYGDPDDVRGLETTNEGPDVGTVNVDILNDEKIDWVLVGDSASLRGCEDISMSAWDKGGVLIAAGLVVAVTDDEGETG
jgi:hypothetical protein